MGDLKFLSSFTGHKTCAANFPCAVCESKKETLEIVGNQRSLNSIKIDAADPLHPRSFEFEPLLPIEPCNFVVPSFHICHGLANRALDVLRKIADTDQLDVFLKNCNAKMDPRKKQLTGEY